MNGWRIIGIDFHRRWRSGWTWLDTASGNSLMCHHGWFTIEWARGEHVDYYKALRRAYGVRL